MLRNCVFYPPPPPWQFCPNFRALVSFNTLTPCGGKVLSEALNVRPLPGEVPLRDDGSFRYVSPWSSLRGDSPFRDVSSLRGNDPFRDDSHLQSRGPFQDVSPCEAMIPFQTLPPLRTKVSCERELLLLAMIPFDTLAFTGARDSFGAMVSFGMLAPCESAFTEQWSLTGR